MSLTDLDGLRQALAETADEVMVECLTFEHASFASPIRVVNDRVDLVRGALTFTAFPFVVRLPARADDSVAEADIFADNVSRELIDEFRTIEDPPKVTYEAVLVSKPNTVQVGPMEFEVRDFLANAGTLSLRIAFAFEVLGERWPKDNFAPWNSPST
jgi:hypothetical protein